MNMRDDQHQVNGYDENRLTPAECHVRQLLVDTGHSVKQIAALRGTSYDTARTQVERIYKKLGVHSRPELIVKCRHPLPLVA